MHSILKAAHEGAPADARPPPPFHGGVDANPQLTRFGCAGVGIFLAEASARLVADVIEEEQVEDWISDAKKIYSLHARAIGRDVKPYTKTELRVLSDKDLKAVRRMIVAEATEPSRLGGVVLSVPTRAANIALYTATDLEVIGGGPYILMALKDVAHQVAGILPPKRVTAFLRELDEVLLREELRAIFAQRRDVRCEKIEACVWRGASTEKARQGRASGRKITHWIGRLESDKNRKDKQYVLVWKVGARWQIISGDRDYVLASVTDDQMASAVSALVG